jgi:hypothetical protein
MFMIVSIVAMWTTEQRIKFQCQACIGALKRNHERDNWLTALWNVPSIWQNCDVVSLRLRGDVKKKVLNIEAGCFVS